jgi:hypothetical protein
MQIVITMLLTIKIKMIKKLKLLKIIKMLTY